MSAPTPTITLYTSLTASGGPYFTLDDPVKGVLDNATYLLVDNIASDITAFVQAVQVQRGRNRELDTSNAGVATVQLRNDLRTFDPAYAAGPYFGNILPGKRVVVTANGIAIFDGLVDDWNFDYPLTTDSTASFEASDSLAVLAAQEFDEWTTTPGETADQRLTSILARSEVSFQYGRSFDTGSATLQGDNVSWGSNVLNYCQLVTKAENGKLFANARGELVFYSSTHNYTGVEAPALRDDNVAGSIPYHGIEIDYGTELLFNRVSIDATGFDKQTVQDATSIATYGLRTLSISNLPLADQYQALTLAYTLLAQYKNPATRFSSVTVMLHGLQPWQQNLILGLDIGSVVRIVYTPNNVSTAIDKFCAIEGIEHLMDNGATFHSVKFSVSNLADGYDVSLNLILDDTTDGKLDTNVIAF